LINKMETKSLKYVLGQLVFYFIFWLVGVGLFWSLIMLGQGKFNYRIDWLQALIFSIIPAYIWFIIAFILTWKDDKVAKAQKAISDAVAKLFENKQKTK